MCWSRREQAEGEDTGWEIEMVEEAARLSS